MAGVSDTAAIAIIEGELAKQKLKGYWPGEAPPDENQDMRMTTTKKASFPCHDDTDDIVKRDDPLADPRLRRLAESKMDNPEDIRADHRRIRKPETVSTIEEWNTRQERLEEEDALVETRKRIRVNVLQRQQEEDASLLPEEEEEEESEYEYETDSDEQPGIAMLIPVFVIKSERDTIAERERLEAEDRVHEDLTKERLKKRKIETKRIVAEEEIRKDEQIRKNIKLAPDIVDVDMNEAEEYETWKVREIARIKRDRDNREAMSKKKEEIARIRNMTEKERREWERKNPNPAAPSKQKWRYLQMYYHKGAFYQTDSDDRSSTAASYNLFYRDFSAPTGEDKMNKTILPKVMQVKHFGRSGRTKWTHLVNEDSTDWNNPWTYNGPLHAKYNAKMAGMNAPIEKPKGNKRIRDWES